MKMTTATKSASSAHAAACQKVESMMEQIQSAIFDITPADRTKIDWSHVGTMNHVAHMLAEALATIKSEN
jgi:hypothetical protein